MSNPVIQCQDLVKSYQDGKNVVNVLNHCQLTVMPGECIAIMGRSGAGKSTLLHCLGGLDDPSQGQVQICGAVMNQLRDKQRAKCRNQNLGFIYQFHHLLPEFNALENVAMPCLIAGNEPDKAKQRAMMLLTEVGLAERAHHKPSELSGGERQRVAIARALANSPKCVLADEPTGNLDMKTADTVFDMMMNLNQRCQTSLVIATHDINLAKKMDRIYHLDNGQLNLV